MKAGGGQLTGRNALLNASTLSSLSVQGSETSQTVRFAAVASEATRTRTVAAPER